MRNLATLLLVFSLNTWAYLFYPMLLAITGMPDVNRMKMLHDKYEIEFLLPQT
jgi:hypothetical protein